MHKRKLCLHGHTHTHTQIDCVYSTCANPHFAPNIHRQSLTRQLDRSHGSIILVSTIFTCIQYLQELCYEVSVLGIKQDQRRDLPQGVEVGTSIIPQSYPAVQYPCHHLQHHHVCANEVCMSVCVCGKVVRMGRHKEETHILSKPTCKVNIISLTQMLASAQ